MKFLSALLYFLLCLIQPVCLPIPEAATIIGGTLAIGEFWSLILGVIGLVLGITIMYFLTKKIGDRLFKNKKKTGQQIERYMSYIKRHAIIITGALFIIPALPDEIIVVGAALSGIPYRILLPMAIFTKTISVGMIAYAEPMAEYLPIGRWELIAIELCVVFIISIIFRLYQNKKQRQEEIK